MYAYIFRVAQRLRWLIKTDRTSPGRSLFRGCCFSGLLIVPFVSTGADPGFLERDSDV